MTEQKIASCCEIYYANNMLKLILRSLYEAMNIPFCDVEEGGNLIWLITRNIIVNQFGELV
jgi:hypothetical protein